MDSSPQGTSADSLTPSKIVLYSFWQSSCSWRVRFALNLKELVAKDIVKELVFGGLDVELLQFLVYYWFLGLSYEYRSVNLAKGEQFSPEFERLNPLKYVPVLVDGDLVLSDSFAILLYLEEKYHQKPLLPADPQLRALNLQAASVVTSSIQPLIMMGLLKSIEEKVGPGKQQLWAQSTIEKGFSALEKLLKNFAGTYATGEEVYMADVFLAPQIAIAITKFKIDMSKFPLLGRMYESYKTLLEFQASQPNRQPDALH